MSLSTLPAMKNSPKHIFFTDFDGTITTADSNDYLTDHLGFGSKLRKQYGNEVLHGRMTFRDAFRTELDSVKTPFNECKSILLSHIKLDPGFKAFHTYAKANNIPIVVLSGGMEPLIRALLSHLIGVDDMEDIQIVSNNVGTRDGKNMDDEGGWQIVYHDDSHFGHDKSLEIRPYHDLPDKDRPIMFYAGDGVSDLSAAKETDLLFAKKGQDLTQYCIMEKVPFIEFEDWSTIHKTVEDIVNGKTDVKAVATKGAVLAAAKNDV